MSYLFFLGRSPEFALAELASFFPSCVPITDECIRVDSETFPDNGNNLPMREALSILGGTVKVARILGTVADLSLPQLSQWITGSNEGEYVFGISTYSGSPAVESSVLRDLKKLLEQAGNRVRYITPRSGTVLSGVAVAKQHVDEINVIKSGEAYIMSRTEAVQDFEEWSIRDYGKPFADSRKGMLPPKAARMAVNIALGPVGVGKTLLDPFCGTGTIPCEASDRGADCLSGDIDEQAVEIARKNSAWFRSRQDAAGDIRCFVSDATHVSSCVDPESIDAIVTEPFMGSAKIGEGRITDLKTLKNTVKGLEKLYIGCLKDWTTVLKPHGIVVMAFPEIHVGKSVFFVKNLIDRCETLGYTNLQGPWAYSRPQAIVRRMFFRMRRK